MESDQLLLVDDDLEFVALMTEYLSGEGFAVAAASDGQQALDYLQSAEPTTRRADLVILDIMMPGMSGTDVLREIRRRHGNELPVLMLSARGDDVDRIIGLELGADDYLPKPCNPRELVARIRAVLRRTQAGAATGDTKTVDGLCINPGARLAELQGKKIDLTSTEFSLLAVLFERAGQVVDKDQLSQTVLGRPLGPYDRNIDMHVSHLRRKLGPLSSGGERIATIRGHGYQLVLPR